VFQQRVIYSVGNWHAEAYKEFEEGLGLLWAKT